MALPQVWDMRALIRFAAVMGPLSSLFDLLTFAGLIALFHASPPEFRTAWFLESMATQILVIFVIRTNGRPWRNSPSPLLTASSLGALAVAIALPFTAVGRWFGFQSPPLEVSLALVAVVAIYLVCSELLKAFATRRLGARTQTVAGSSSARSVSKMPQPHTA